MDTEPADAFGLLATPTRMATMSAFAERDPGATLSFTELFEATDEETTAGFAYHLRQLRGHYVEQVEAGYRLTDAGRRVVRALAAGAYTERVDRDPVPVPEPCPLCDGDLTARTTDNVVTVGCADCERDVCKLPFPPGGFADHEDDADLLAAVDRLYRGRVRLLREGTCPDCGGRTERRVEVSEGIALAALSCTACGERVRCPATVTLLAHPAVVAFARNHGADPRDRPVWNVGDAWTETVLSTDPVCVRVGYCLDGEELALLVGADGSVGHVERTERGDDAAAGAGSAAA
ncbi:DUF7351 domain-containing protein [Halosegnis marinus]|uniref:ArsR family transcriptional regulator n=1 Tax=Halosegnis marinus TaxID=3034023 RepID=A0ABD5ZSX2_9EURY|nr:ArsR family transcriptional regulator [Halosegnis sp. DT85]